MKMKRRRCVDVEDGVDGVSKGSTLVVEMASLVVECFDQLWQGLASRGLLLASCWLATGSRMWPGMAAA
jgi:hypothetical protein